MLTPSARADPMRRTCDTVQSWLARVLLAVLIVGLPAASAGVGLLSYRAQLHTGRVQAAARHTVAAHLTADATAPANQAVTEVRTTAAWTASDGTTRTAPVHVWPGEKAGTPVRLWVDAGDTVVPAPVTRGQAAATGWTAAAAAAGSVSLLCLAVWKGSVRVLDRRRSAAWDAEWDLVEPQWSRRQPN